MIWGDLCARARGLATHLLSDQVLAELEMSWDGPELAETLARAGYPAAELDAGEPAALERAARRRVAADLDVLARWAGARVDALAVLVDDEDRRSLRAIARGLVAEAPVEARVAATVPTRRLAEPLLRELAAAPSLAAMAERLARAEHPCAAALAAAAETTPPDLLAIESRLARCWAARVRRSRRRGGVALAVYVAQVIDVENASAALLIAERGAELDAKAQFLDGGERLDRDAFARVAGAPPDRARELAAAALADTPLAGALGAGDRLALEDAALAWQLATQRRLRLAEPLGAAPVLWLALSRRREARLVRRAAWRVALSRGADGGAR